MSLTAWHARLGAGDQGAGDAILLPNDAIVLPNDVIVNDIWLKVGRTLSSVTMGSEIAILGVADAGSRI